MRMWLSNQLINIVFLFYATYRGKKSMQNRFLDQRESQYYKLLIITWLIEFDFRPDSI